MLPKTFRVQKLSDWKTLAKIILPYLKPNTFLLLSGELGVGKTTFVQFLAKELGINQLVNSPTFSILRRYEIKNDYYLNHFDFFRLTNQDNINDFEELTFFNLNFIEWPEKNLNFWQGKKNISLNFKPYLEKNLQIRIIEISESKK